MSRQRRSPTWLCVFVALCVVGSAAGIAQADLTMKQVSKLTTADTKTEEVKNEMVYLKGPKLRIEDVDSGSVLIIRKDRRRIWQLDPDSRTYVEVPFMESAIPGYVDTAKADLAKAYRGIVDRAKGFVSRMETLNTKGMMENIEPKVIEYYEGLAKEQLRNRSVDGRQRKKLARQLEAQAHAQVELYRNALVGVGGVAGSPSISGPGGGMGMAYPGAPSGMGYGSGMGGAGSLASANTLEELVDAAVAHMNETVDAFEAKLRQIYDSPRNVTVEQGKVEKTIAGFPCVQYTIGVSVGSMSMGAGMGMGMGMGAGPPGVMGSSYGGGGIPGTPGSTGQPRTGQLPSMLRLIEVWVVKKNPLMTDPSPLTFLDPALGYFRPVSTAPFRSTTATTRATPQGFGGQPTARRQDIEWGIPMQAAYNIVRNGKEMMLETEVTGVEFGAVQADLFEVPAGYAKSDSNIITYW